MINLGGNTQYWSEIVPPGLIAPPRIAPYARIFTGIGESE
jgi:hypothetical protein